MRSPLMNSKDKIVLYYGTDAFKAAYKLMEETPVWKDWESSSLIGLKPNLVVSKGAQSGATTHPEFAAGVIEFLRDQGFTNLSILEGSWVGDTTERAFKVCGYEDLSEKYAIPLVDLQKDPSRTCSASYGDYKICQSILDLDHLINLPVLKGHCQTRMTCALKNLKGCIPDSEKRRYHSEGLFQPIADLNEVLKADLILVDALNGDPTFEEGGNPQTMNLFMAGTDPVLIDSYACSLLGLSPSEVPYIGLAQALGAGNVVTVQTEILSLNRGEGVALAQQNGLMRTLAKGITEKGACSACYANLIHALKGCTEPLPKPIYIGQGFKNVTLEGWGIGDCLSHCTSHVKGCPPSPGQIKVFLD